MKLRKETASYTITHTRTTLYVVVRLIAVGISEEVEDAVGYRSSDVIVIHTPNVGVDAREAAVFAVISCA